ncbi:MAG: YfiR family protein [Burkholderiaceae bacterium]|nr:YfiR family protein [Burkholderiaceae bacterium]
MWPKTLGVWALVWLGLLTCTLPARADELPEYRLKAAFMYNFALFTEWPTKIGRTLDVCIAGIDPFGKEIDALQGKAVGERSINLQRKAGGESLSGCHVVFISQSAIGTLPRLLESLRGRPILTVADTPGAARQGVALNMTVAQNKITFEANLTAARNAGLDLSSKLLRLATEVYQ